MSQESRIRLSILVAREEFDLVEANLLAAVEAYPALDLGVYLERLEMLAADARSRGGDFDGVVATLAETGLTGDRLTYDDPRNSFLNDVLERGRGLPIALSALAIGVGFRTGAVVAGIAMPGHVVIADLSGAAPRYVDPFNGWAEVTEEGCARLVRQSAGADLEPGHLVPVGPHAMLTRMLSNLRHSYLRRRRLADALWAAELGLLVTPDDGALVREHVVLQAGLGRYDAAEAEARAYMEANPDTPERQALERQIAAVQDMRRSMN